MSFQSAPVKTAPEKLPIYMKAFIKPFTAPVNSDFIIWFTTVGINVDKIV